MIINKAVPFTVQEKQFIIKYYGILSTDAISQALGRTAQQIANCASWLRHKGFSVKHMKKRQRSYSEADKQYIVQSYGKVPIRAMAIKLGVSEKSIRSYASLLRSQGYPVAYLTRRGSITMSRERYSQIMNNYDENLLTREEISKGWHFCYDWDGLLVGPGMVEYESCNCRRRDSIEELSCLSCKDLITKKAADLFDEFDKADDWSCGVNGRVIAKHVGIIDIKPDIPKWCPVLKKQGWVKKHKKEE